MTGWIILAVILLILTVINLIRVGVDMAYEGGNFTLSAKAAGILLQLIPKEEGEEKKPKKEKEPKKKKEPREKKKGLPLGLNREELFDAVKRILKKLLRFPGKFLIDHFKFHIVVAGKDPYDTALGYAYLNEALSVLMPLARNAFRVRKSDVRTEVDFISEDLSIDFAMGLTIRIGQIVGLLLTIVWIGLLTVIKSKRRQKREAKAAAKEQTKPVEKAVQGHTEEKNTAQDINQAEERMDSNG